MSTENKSCAPRLRFPGFTGEWEEKKIGDVVGSVKRGQSLQSKDYMPGDIPVVAGGKQYAGYHNVANHEGSSITISGSGASAGYVALHKTPIFATDCSVIDEGLGYDLSFIYYVLQNMQDKIYKLQTGGAQPHIYPKNIEDIIAAFPPSPAEQKKIAECLAEKDRLIAAQGENVDALKEKKIGLMQQLFPQDGETTPRMRFAGFVDDWVVKTLRDVSSSFSGGTPKSGESKFYGGNIPFIRSGEIHSDRTELFITEDGLNNSSAKLVKQGDLLIALYGATSGDVAISKINGAINQAILCIRSNIIDTDFLCHYLEYNKGFITSRFLQGGQGNLSGDIIMSLKVAFPSLAEQQKIAECLSALDDQIAAESAKLEALKDHKKGLMQQLFPQPAK